MLMLRSPRGTTPLALGRHIAEVSRPVERPVALFPALRNDYCAVMSSPRNHHVLCSSSLDCYHLCRPDSTTLAGLAVLTTVKMYPAA